MTNYQVHVVTHDGFTGINRTKRVERGNADGIQWKVFCFAVVHALLLRSPLSPVKVFFHKFTQLLGNPHGCLIAGRGKDCEPWFILAIDGGKVA